MIQYVWVLSAEAAKISCYLGGLFQILPSSVANQPSDFTNTLMLQVLNAMYLKDVVILINLAFKMFKTVKIVKIYEISSYNNAAITLKSEYRYIKKVSKLTNHTCKATTYVL